MADEETIPLSDTEKFSGRENFASIPESVGNLQKEIKLFVLEIYQNIASGNLKGRNTWGRGLRGDIEELLGWHMDHLNDSPLNQQDRIRILKGISAQCKSGDLEKLGDIVKFANEKIIEISIDEVDRYIKDFAGRDSPGESQVALALRKEIETQEGMLRHSTRKPQPKDIYDPQVADERYKIYEAIEQNKLKLYNLIFEIAE